jgi:hypothetical protein
MPSFELTTWDRGAVREAAPEDVWTIAPRADDGFVPWPGIFTGAFFHGFYYWVANHSRPEGVGGTESRPPRGERNCREAVIHELTLHGRGLVVTVAMVVYFN